MTIDTPIAETDTVAARPRDANNTRQLLLDSARLRFARDGYSSTTVRDIATDAGVNVALINRYFTSKEGLFEECLALAAKDLDRSGGEPVTIATVVTRMLRQVTDSTGEPPLHLLLLLRTSGDERADQIRRDTLRGFAQGLAAASGWREGDDETLILRAELAIAAGLGIVLLRSTTALEPLASATESDLTLPITQLFAALLSPESREG
ncbi:TetR/AcrR family transcriptional regulator [soil metagenome]